MPPALTNAEQLPLPALGCADAAIQAQLAASQPVLRHFCGGHTPACMPPAHGQSDNMQAFQQLKNQMPFTEKSSGRSDGIIGGVRFANAPGV